MRAIKNITPGGVVILADGSFPERGEALDYLRQAHTIIACDGATQKLLDFGLEPMHIVGDMDSLSEDLKLRFASIISPSKDQETNDLTKAVLKALDLGVEQAVILGATGQREDHTLGNIGLLAEHAHKLELQMISDYGLFIPLAESAHLPSYKGQQISIFNPIGQAKISTSHLKYPITNRSLNNWWEGTLNEATGEQFSLAFNAGVLVVYCAF